MHVVLSLNPGGTERLVIEIAKALAPRIEPVVCCLDEPGAWAGELTAIGVPVIALHRAPGFQPRLGYAIAEVADAHGVDVLHCHHYSPFIYGQLAALVGRRRRVIFTEHGQLSGQKRSFKRSLLNPIVGRLPTAIYAVSGELRRGMIDEGLPSRRVQVLHNGIDPGARPTSIARARARHALGIGDNVMLVGTAGRLDPVKDLSTLIAATTRLRQSVPAAKLAVIGDGPERGALEALASRVAPGAVLFTGYRSDVRLLLPAFDIFVNSSTHEGVSLTVLEAMAAALPVVATRVGGTPEVVADNETGVLVPSGNPERLAAAMKTLALAPERRRQMGEAGRFRMKKHFSLQAMTRGYLSAYLGGDA